MPPGFPGALPLSYDRGLRSAEHETRRARPRQPGLTSPDTEPSEGGPLVHESESACKVKMRTTVAFFFGNEIFHFSWWDRTMPRTDSPMGLSSKLRAAITVTPPMSHTLAPFICT